MTIPKSFYLLGQKITVTLDPHLVVKNKIGEAHLDANKIKLQSKIVDGYEIADEKIEQTFCHELVHQIIDKMGYKPDDEIVLDERFVDLFGGLLHQYETTKEVEERVVLEILSVEAELKTYSDPYEMVVPETVPTTAVP